MRFTSIALSLALSALAFANPTVVRRQSSQAQVVLVLIDTVAKDAAQYKAVIDRFPVGGSNETQLAALQDIYAASAKLKNDFADKALWDVLHSDFKFSAEDQQTIADALSSKAQDNLDGAQADLQKLEPTIKKLGCYDLLNDVRADVQKLADSLWNAMNYIAVWRVSGDFNKGPIMAVYTQITKGLTDSLTKYQVGPYTGPGDEPTDNCQGS